MPKNYEHSKNILRLRRGEELFTTTNNKQQTTNNKQQTTNSKQQEYHTAQDHGNNFVSRPMFISVTSLLVLRMYKVFKFKKIIF